MGQARCGIGRVCEAGVVAGAGDSAPGSPSVVRRAGHPHVVGGGCGQGKKVPTLHGTAAEMATWHKPHRKGHCVG